MIGILASSMILASIMIIAGFVTLMSALILLIYIIWWKIIEMSNRGKRWHQYIKSHKADFLNWALETKKRNKKPRDSI